MEAQTILLEFKEQARVRVTVFIGGGRNGAADQAADYRAANAEQCSCKEPIASRPGIIARASAPMIKRLSVIQLSR